MSRVIKNKNFNIMKIKKQKNKFFKFSLIITFNLLLSACSHEISNNLPKDDLTIGELGKQNEIAPKISDQPNKDSHISNDTKTEDKPVTDNNNLPSSKENFETVDNTSFVNLQKGGNFNELNVSKYLAVIQTISQLKKTTILSKLDNTEINKELKKEEKFKNLNLQIYDGSSELTGTLKLKLTGKYLNKDILENLSIITIKGFLVFNPINLKLNQLKLNQNLFLDGLKKATDFELFDKNQWEKYLSESNFSYQLNYSNLLYKLGSDDISKRFKFDFNYANNNKIIIKAKQNLRKIENNNWVEISNSQDYIIIKKELDSSSEYLIDLPKKETALNFFITKVKVINNPTKYSNEFASYYQGKSYETLIYLDNYFLELDEKYKSYIKKQYHINNLSIEHMGILANDFSGELYLNFALLTDPGESYSVRSSTATQIISGFKKFDSIINNKSISIQGSLVPKTLPANLDIDEKNNLFWKSLRKIVASNYKAKKMTVLNREFNYDNVLIAKPKFSNNEDSITLIKEFNENRQTREDYGEEFEKLNKLTNYRLLDNKLLLGRFVFSNYIYDDKFFIKSLHAEIESNTKAIVTKSSSTYQYSFDFNYILEIANASSANDFNSTKSVKIPGKLLAFFSFDNIEKNEL